MQHVFYAFVCRVCVVATLWGGVVSTLSGADVKSQLATEGKADIEIQHCSIDTIDHVMLASDRMGVIGKILVKEGDRVSAETLVVQLKNEEAVALERQTHFDAQNDVIVRMAIKNRQVAEVELAQANEANKKIRVLTPQELLRIELNLDRAILEVEQSEHEREMKRLEHDVALARLKAHDFNSPINGVVIHVIKAVGEAVQQGENLIHLVNVDRLKVEGYVSVEIASQLKVGDRVTVLSERQTDPQKAPINTNGTIQFIDVVAQPVTHEVRIWAEVDNQDHHFFPGMRATMRVKPGNNDDNKSVDHQTDEKATIDQVSMTENAH